jgi:hypothetical protein
MDIACSRGSSEEDRSVGCRRGIHELQNDIKEVVVEDRDIGIPYVSHKD